MLSSLLPLLCVSVLLVSLEQCAHRIGQWRGPACPHVHPDRLRGAFGVETVVTIDEPPPSKPIVPKVQKPRVVTTRVPTEKPPKADPPPVQKDEPIPDGVGRLSIAVGGSPGRVSLTVQGEAWDEPPVQRRVASGVYRVSIKLADGTQASTRATVMPDKLTVVTLDASSSKWTTQIK